MPRSKTNYKRGILSVGEVAELIGLSTPTVRRLFDSGKISGVYRLGKERRIPAPSVYNYLTSNHMIVPFKLLNLVSAFNEVHPKINFPKTDITELEEMMNDLDM